MQDLSSPTRYFSPHPTAVEGQNFNHWTPPGKSPDHMCSPVYVLSRI